MNERKSQKGLGINLKDVPIEVLAQALLSRKKEFFEEGNWLIPSVFELHKVMGPVVCVDGIPCRLNKDGKMELMAIRRKTGPYPEKLVLIGGTIFKGEDISTSLRRHFMNDFGVEIEMPKDPFCLTQYKKESDEGWMQDPGKEHVIAPVFFVRIKTDKTPHQSLKGDPIEWFSKDSMPADKEFGYINQRVYHNAFRFKELSLP
jgi:ADP-ribose pyrophosphatase YjhB (NUDIX family)